MSTSAVRAAERRGGMTDLSLAGGAREQCYSRVPMQTAPQEPSHEARVQEGYYHKKQEAVN
jgi:hypothetical protein